MKIFNQYFETGKEKNSYHSETSSCILIFHSLSSLEQVWQQCNIYNYSSCYSRFIPIEFLKSYGRQRASLYVIRVQNGRRQQQEIICSIYKYSGLWKETRQEVRFRDSCWYGRARIRQSLLIGTKTACQEGIYKVL